jgi:rubredoxin
MTATEWECMDCGYLFEGKQPPRRCPDCGEGDAWAQVAYVEYFEAWECTSCGYVSEREQPPRGCPECEATDTWEKVEVEVEYVEDLDASDPGDESDDEESEEDDERGGGPAAGQLRMSV